MSSITTFPIVSKDDAYEEANNILKSARQSNVAENTDMGPRRTTIDADEEFSSREIQHNMMLAQTAFFKTMELKAAADTKPNGNSQRNTIVAALIISFIPQAFNAVWWTRGTERDTVSRVGTIEYKVEQSDKRSTIYER